METGQISYDINEVSLDHPFQDINKLRAEDFDRPRFIYAEQLLPQDGHGKTIVDIGGGACEFLRIAQKRGYYGVFVDGNPQNVERAKDLGFVALWSNFTREIDLDNESMDGAVMLDVIEHIPNAEKLLMETWRILRLNGFLILSTLNVASIGLRMCALKGKPQRNEGYHFRFFNRSLFDKKIIEAGFKIVKRNPIANPHVTKWIGFINRFIGNRNKFCIIPEKWENLLARGFLIKAIKI